MGFGDAIVDSVSVLVLIFMVWVSFEVGAGVEFRRTQICINAPDRMLRHFALQILATRLIRSASRNEHPHQKTKTPYSG